MNLALMVKYYSDAISPSTSESMSWKMGKNTLFCGQDTKHSRDWVVCHIPLSPDLYCTNKENEWLENFASVT